MRTAFVMLTLLALAMPACAQDAEAPAADQIKLSLTIALRHGPPVGEELAEDAPADTIFLEGEPIDVAFTITNVGETPFNYVDRNYNRGGRLELYQVHVADMDGQPIEDPRGGPGGGGGLGAFATLEPGESFTKHVWLNEWVMPLLPGRYSVSGVAVVWPSDHNLKLPPISSPAVEIGILPRGDAEMAAWVDELGAVVMDAAEVAREAWPLLPDPDFNPYRWFYPQPAPRGPAGPTGLMGPAGPAGPPPPPPPPPDPAELAAERLNEATRRAKPALLCLGFTGSIRALPYLIETLYGLSSLGSDGFMYMRDKQACEDALLAALDERGATSTGQYLLRRLDVPEERTLPRTLEWLADADPTRRAGASSALGLHYDSGDAPLDALIGVLDDEDMEVRESATWSLGRFRGPKAVAGLLTASHDPEEHVRTAAAQGLASKRDPAALPRLQELLSDAPGVAWWAVYGLAHLDAPEAMAALRTGLNAPAPEVRLDVAVTLLSLGDDSGRELIAQSLESLDREGRWRLMERLRSAVRKRGGPDTHDRNTWLRWLRAPLEDQ